MAQLRIFEEGPMRTPSLVAAAFASSAFMTATAPTAAFAQSLTDLTTEVMMGDSAVNNEIVAANWSPAVGTQLDYTTDVMSDGDYTYGTTSDIDGQSFSLSGGGTFSAPGGVDTWNTFETGKTRPALPIPIGLLPTKRPPPRSPAATRLFRTICGWAATTPTTTTRT
jgi:hypothetical protein